MGRSTSTKASTRPKGKNQKKQKWIKITAVVVCVIAACGVGFSIFSLTQSSEKLILAEKAYLNGAWGFRYQGEAIFTDGTIYEWDFDDEYDDDDYDVETRKEFGDWILKHGTRVDKTISGGDLKAMADTIKNLNDVIERTQTANDLGSSYVLVWKGDKRIKLKESGDLTGENKSQEAQDLINIIDKYLSKAYWPQLSDPRFNQYDR